MRTAAIILAACFLLSAAPAHAARFSGAYLYRMCSTNAQGQEAVKGGHTACQAYIAAVLDYHTILQSMGIAPKVDLCVPDNVTSAQLHEVVLEYLERNKQHDSYVAAPAVTMALFEKYPCKR